MSPALPEVGSSDVINQHGCRSELGAGIARYVFTEWGRKAAGYRCHETSEGMWTILCFYVTIFKFIRCSYVEFETSAFWSFPNLSFHCTSDTDSLSDFMQLILSYPNPKSQSAAMTRRGEDVNMKRIYLLCVSDGNWFSPYNCHFNHQKNVNRPILSFLY